jgi:hypothetical protein
VNCNNAEFPRNGQRAFVLGIVAATKAAEGAWIIILMIPVHLGRHTAARIAG